MEESLDPGAGAETSSSPLTPSNDSHLQSDLLNITRLLEHDNNTNNCPLTSFQFDAFLKECSKFDLKILGQLVVLQHLALEQWSYLSTMCDVVNYMI